LLLKSNGNVISLLNVGEWKWPVFNLEIFTLDVPSPIAVVGKVTVNIVFNPYNLEVVFQYNQTMMVLVENPKV